MIESACVRRACACLCLLLSACGGAVRIPEDSFYRLAQAVPETALAAPTLPGVLLVEAGAAAPIYRDRALLYSDPGTPDRLQRYHYHYWVDSPPRLLQSDLAAYLRAARVADQVVVPADGIRADNLLRVEIVRFEHMRASQGGRVDIELRFTQTDRASGRLLLQEMLKGSAAVDGDDFAAVAASYQRVLAQLYAELLAKLGGRE